MTSKTRKRPGLSGAFMEIADMTSEAIATDLMRHFGGTRIYVPNTIPETHELAVVGPEAADILARMFGGTTISVPNHSNILRRQAIAKLAKEGLKRREIAKRVGVSESRVYQILGEIKESLKSEVR